MGIVIALVSLTCLVAANITLKKSFKDFSPSVSFVIFALLSLVFWPLAGLVLGVKIEYVPTSLIFGLLSALLGQAVYFYVLEKGELSITNTILATFSVYTILFSFFINQERLLPLQSVCVILSILGTIAVAAPEKFDRTKIKNFSYILWPVFGAMSIGFSDALTKNFINTAGSGTFLVGVSIGQVLVSIAYFFFSKQKLSQLTNIFREFSKYNYAFWGAVLVSIHTMTLFIAFQFADASLISPIVTSSPAFTVLLAVLLLKEKISRKDMFGVILVLIGIVGISLVPTT